MAWMAAWFEGAQHSRAERYLRSTEIAAAAHSDGKAEAVTLRTLLQEARTALVAHKVEECWHLLNAARRILAGLGEQGDRLDAARVLLIEAEKVSTWRRKSIEKILGDGSVAPTPPALVAALLLRDEYYENRYHRIEMQREQMKALVAITAGALLVTLGIAATADIPNLAVWEGRSLALILMFGILGASFSAAQSSSAGALTTLIPELMQSKSIALTRTILGACPGLAAYAFLHSGLLNLGDVNMAKSLTVAFVGGFSERLVVKMVETVAGKDTPAK
jgi:hypothetical protein